jgi:hypothetical protein
MLQLTTSRPSETIWILFAVATPHGLNAGGISSSPHVDFIDMQKRYVSVFLT